MYSILKTKKKSLVHKKYSPVTNSLFLTNNHVLFTFADKSYVVFYLHLSTSDPQQIVAEGTVPQQIIQAGRISQGKCILITSNCSQIFLLTFGHQNQHHQHDNSYKVNLLPLQRGIFANMLSSNPNSNLLNTMGCQIKLHTFNNHQNFIVQFNIYEDHKIILDCYAKLNNKGQEYVLNTLQNDLKINGTYVCEDCDKNNGEIAIYKQQEISQADWQLNIVRPFHTFYKSNTQQENPYNYNIILPTERFHQNLMIMQVITWRQPNQYLIITHSLQNNQIQGHLLHRSMGTNTIQTLNNFSFFKENPNFISIFHTDPYKQIFYATTHTHLRIDGELYENGLIIGNMTTGNSIEKGYWSYKNMNLSPDARYILDVPTQFQSYGEILYHVRLLLSKSSLYMFLIENSKLKDLSDSFKEMIVGLL